MTTSPVSSHPLAHPNPGGTRPVERIDEVLAALGAYWRANPDLRLGQIVHQFARPAEVALVEDDFLLERLTNAAAAPPTRSRYVARTAQRGARRMHVFHDEAGLGAKDSFTGSPLCGGADAIERRYYMDDQSTPFLLDPIENELTAEQITCDRCWSSYTRLISGRVV